MSQELSTNVLDQLKQAYPQHAEDNYEKNFLPQIRFKAKPVLDDDDKVVTKAGTFVKVTRSEEKNAEDKYDYTEEVIGTTLKDVSVVFERYRLSFYDAAAGSYVSSPIFDDKDNEVVKLFQGGSEIASGTVAELQQLPQFAFEDDGKKKSKLVLQKVLYIVLPDGELCEMALSRGNGYAWSTFKRTTDAPIVHITIDSKKTEYGGNKYNEMTFTAGEYLSDEEATRNLEMVKNLRESIVAEKAYYGQTTAAAPDVTPLPGGDDDNF